MGARWCGMGEVVWRCAAVSGCGGMGDVVRDVGDVGM